MHCVNAKSKKEQHMTIQDDETLQMYLEESIEHLADIETDLLAIEEGGADIDEELVNKVYRAAHSIKGGAGFMGLTTIKDLTHEMENILGKIRSREMIPNPDIVNILLNASDTLKELMDDVFTSNDVDISELVSSLKTVAEGGASPEPTPDEPETAAPVEDTEEAAPAADTIADKETSPPDSESTTIRFPDGRSAFKINRNVLDALIDEGKYVYLAKIDIADDIVKKKRKPSDIIEEMQQTGTIIKSSMSLEAFSTIHTDNTDDIDVFTVLFATILKPDDVNILFEINECNIFKIDKDMKTHAIVDSPALEVKSEPAPEVKPEPAPEIKAPKAPAKPAAVSVKPKPVKKTQPASPEKKAPDPTKKKTSVQKTEHDASLRVHVSLLDQLMTLAGELVLSRNQLLQSMSSEDHRNSEIAGQRIDLITSELQEAIMLTRMQSIGNVFQKFPRVVRDLARSLGKEVDLNLEGKEVELDKTIIEAIGDPLTHLVRNAVDHGIEIPEERKRRGKKAVGQIFLKAYHEAGQVNIEISDDGKGLDGNQLTQKALEKGLISEDQAKIMSEKEKTNLIFLPGFSTAEKVTDVSGRGVGMDVVKTNLDKLGGIIDIESNMGEGSTIRIKLPLTLAIIPCQIVLTGGERYAIPQVNLEELLRIPANQVVDRIERVGDAEVVRLRGNLLPLIKLTDVIGTASVYTDPVTNEKKENRRKQLSDRRSRTSPPISAGDKNSEDIVNDTGPDQEKRNINERRYRAASALNIVVVSTGAMKYGLVVDELHDSEEIVVKPLGRDLKKCKGYAGATIMGDGRVALILDVSNLAQMAGLTSVEGSARAADIAAENFEKLRAKKDKQSLLVFRSAEDEQFAAPLNLVERIEKIKSGDIEEVGGKRVMKYRGGSLPLFSIDEVAMVKPLADSENLLVIVFIVSGREVGLLAMGPLDAMEVSLDVDGITLKQPGIMGSAIINDHTTLMVDIFEIVQTLNPEWFEDMEAAQTEAGDAATILFAEDSKFFRSQVTSYLEDEGYVVLEAEDGAIAWDILNDHADEVTAVVTDIEMPNMNGFELTKKIRDNVAYSHLPVIALTTLAGDEDIAKGAEVGIDDYQIKLDREKLLKSIYKMLTN